MTDDSLRIPTSLTNIDGIDEKIEQIRVDTQMTREQLQHLLDAFDGLGLLRTNEIFNGWSNYETWNVHLWFTNDQGSYNLCRELAHDCIEEAATCSQVEEGIWQELDARRFLLSDRLREHVEEINPLVGTASLFYTAHIN